jgi:cytochrome c biogenesis protein CcmG, thiol:disulfide interchange protein DsbE
MTHFRRVLVGALAVSLMWGVTGCSTPQATPATGDRNPNDPPSPVQVTESLRDPDRVRAAALRPCPVTAPASVGNARGDLPPLTLPCLGAGSAVTLSELRGHPVVLNVWATWCGPCRAELPLFDQLDRDASGRLVVLGVDIQEPSADAALSFLADEGIRLPSVTDPDGLIRQALAITATPVTVFVTQEGRLAGRKIGQFATSAELRTLTRRYLGVEVSSP